VVGGCLMSVVGGWWHFYVLWCLSYAMRGGAREKRKEREEEERKMRGKGEKRLFSLNLIFFTYSTSREVSNNSDTMKLKHKMLDVD
jgi:hypothetical protein